jgi:nudix-type nucleoside diphosphatase (YffH/AdpP family)
MQTGMLIEACAGLLDTDDPESCIRREAEEETGFRVHHLQKLFEAYMSPGSVTEKLHFFASEYEPCERTNAGGGHVSEGEDIETIEFTLTDALARVSSGEIEDAKTIMLLLFAQTTNFFEHLIPIQPENH